MSFRHSNNNYNKEHLNEHVHTCKKCGGYVYCYIEFCQLPDLSSWPDYTCLSDSIPERAPAALEDIKYYLKITEQRIKMLWKEKLMQMLVHEAETLMNIVVECDNLVGEHLDDAKKVAARLKLLIEEYREQENKQ